MNSQRITELHPRPYESFFDRYSIVVSGCFSVPWSNELLGFDTQAPLVRSKLPLRCYLGITETGEPGIRLDDILQFESEERGFSVVPWVAAFSGERGTETAIAEILANEGIDSESGLRIGLLSEIPKGRSVGFAQTVFATLAFGLRKYAKTKLGKNCPEAAETSSITSPGTDYTELTRLALRLSRKSESDIVATSVARSTFLPTANPVAYFSEPCVGAPLINAHESPCLRELDIFQTVEGDAGTLPIDFWIAYCGTPADDQSVDEIRQSDALEAERITSFAERMSEKFAWIESRWSEYVSMGNCESIQRIKSCLNYRTVELFDRLLRFGWADDSAAEAFCRNVDRYRKLLAMVTEQSPFAEDLWHCVRNHVPSGRMEIGIMPLYSGKHGGSYLVVAPRWPYRQAVDAALSEIRTLGYGKAETIYRSHLDGGCSEWVKVCKLSARSEASEQAKVVCIDTSGKKRYGTYMAEISDNSDRIVFDAIGRKIYFRGERLTSKEIPSQNAANDLFERLLENVGEEIPNHSLPVSSYSKNRNEMVSKIISPLSKFTKERLHFPLPVKCTGSITEFRILLEKADLPISLIKKP